MSFLSLVRRAIALRARRRIRRCLAAVGWERKVPALRRRGFAKLRGEGVEIGAFEHPAPLPTYCRTRYVDAITPQQAAALFPEIDAGTLVVPDFLVDVSRDGLVIFRDAQWDYVVACHVIEHLPNPGRFVQELFRVVRPGGWVAIAAPDKRFTFDVQRPETSLAILKGYFANGRNVTPADYEDISRYVNTSDLALSGSERWIRLETYRDRREHLNIWTSESFKRFLVEALKWSGVEAIPVYEVDGDTNGFEYFGIWQKR